VKTGAAKEDLLSSEKKVEKKAEKKEVSAGTIDHGIVAEPGIREKATKPKKAVKK
jgi:hypothetical protein